MAVDADSEALWGAVHEAVRDLLAADGMSHLEQLGIEYVEALRSGARLRELADEHPFSTLKSGRVVIHPGYEAADRDLRRGAQLAKILGLVGRRISAADDPFADIDAHEATPVSLADRRKARSKRGDGAA